METKETKKRADKPVQLTIAKLPGRRYEEDKPRDCRYCYYWAGRVRGCSRKECWYLIPLPEKPKKEFDANGVPLKALMLPKLIMPAVLLSIMMDIDVFSKLLL